VLEGVVTNVAAFGAFVDIGVHQDGLVHVSALSKTFVKDPRDVVKPGDIVRVKVMEVDQPRKRISLTLRLDDEVGAGERPQGGAKGQTSPRNMAAAPKGRSEASGGAFADAFRKAGLTGRK
jgi:protein Tex